MAPHHHMFHTLSSADERSQFGCISALFQMFDPHPRIRLFRKHAHIADPHRSNAREYSNPNPLKLSKDSVKHSPCKDGNNSMHATANNPPRRTGGGTYNTNHDYSRAEPQHECSQRDDISRSYVKQARRYGYNDCDYGASTMNQPAARAKSSHTSSANILDSSRATATIRERNHARFMEPRAAGISASPELDSSDKLGHRRHPRSTMMSKSMPGSPSHHNHITRMNHHMHHGHPRRRRHNSNHHGCGSEHIEGELAEEEEEESIHTIIPARASIDYSDCVRDNSHNYNNSAGSSKWRNMNHQIDHRQDGTLMNQYSPLEALPNVEKLAELAPPTEYSDIILESFHCSSSSGINNNNNHHSSSQRLHNNPGQYRTSSFDYSEALRISQRLDLINSCSAPRRSLDGIHNLPPNPPIKDRLRPTDHRNEGSNPSPSALKEPHFPTFPHHHGAIKPGLTKERPHPNVIARLMGLNEMVSSPGLADNHEVINRKIPNCEPKLLKGLLNCPPRSQSGPPRTPNYTNSRVVCTTPTLIGTNATLITSNPIVISRAKEDSSLSTSPAPLINKYALESARFKSNVGREEDVLRGSRRDYQTIREVNPVANHVIREVNQTIREVNHVANHHEEDANYGVSPKDMVLGGQRSNSPSKRVIKKLNYGEINDLPRAIYAANNSDLELSEDNQRIASIQTRCRLVDRYSEGRIIKNLNNVISDNHRRDEGDAKHRIRSKIVVIRPRDNMGRRVKGRTLSMETQFSFNNDDDNEPGIHAETLAPNIKGVIRKGGEFDSAFKDEIEKKESRLRGCDYADLEHVMKAQLKQSKKHAVTNSIDQLPILPSTKPCVNFNLMRGKLMKGDYCRAVNEGDLRRRFAIKDGISRNGNDRQLSASASLLQRSNPRVNRSHSTTTGSVAAMGKKKKKKKKSNYSNVKIKFDSLEPNNSSSISNNNNPMQAQSDQGNRILLKSNGSDPIAQVIMENAALAAPTTLATSTSGRAEIESEHDANCGKGNSKLPRLLREKKTSPSASLPAMVNSPISILEYPSSSSSSSSSSDLQPETICAIPSDRLPQLETTGDGANSSSSYVVTHGCSTPQRSCNKEIVVPETHQENEGKKHNFALDNSNAQRVYLDSTGKPLSQVIELIVQQSSQLGILSKHLPKLDQSYASDEILALGTNNFGSTREYFIISTEHKNNLIVDDVHDGRLVSNWEANSQVVLDCILEILEGIHRSIQADASHAILTTTSHHLYEPIWWKSRATSLMPLDSHIDGYEVTSDQGLVSKVWLRKTLWRKLRPILLTPPLTPPECLADASIPKSLVVERSSSSTFIPNKMVNTIKVDELSTHEEYGWTNGSTPCIFNVCGRNIVLDLEDAIFEELLMETIGL